MEKKVNLAELLKNCPHGMELDCTMYDNLYFKCVRGHAIYPIVCYTVDSKGEKHETSFNWYGKHTPIDTAKCAIFPKGKTTWEGFVPPCKFKDGDILSYQCGVLNNRTIYIYRYNNVMNTSYYVALSGDIDSTFMINDKEEWTLNGYNDTARLATEEEKQKLFDAIKDNGYRWNEESKTLEELPKFKDGDILYCDANDYGENDDDFKYIFIFDKLEYGKYYYSHCHLGGSEFYDDETYLVEDYPVRFATEEEKQKLFDAIKDNGYRWNEESKTLEELPKFKDGDIVFSGKDLISIFKKLSPSKSLHSYVSTMHNGCVFVDVDCWTSDNMRLATDEEKEKLFKAISDEGYKWYPDTKTLLTVPIFKAGDRIKRKDTPAVHAIKMVEKDLYVFDDLRSIPISVQGDYELVVKKFDINILKPFDRVLVRSYDSDEWRVALWGHFKEKHDMRYDTTRGTYRRCIPYEGNEHLLGKTDDCDDYYKTW